MVAFVVLAEKHLMGGDCVNLGCVPPIRRNAAPYLLVPLFPCFLFNLVPAFVGVRLPTYIVTTALGILPGTAVFSLAGAGLGDVRRWAAPSTRAPC